MKRTVCPRCQSKNHVKYGFLAGKQRFKCKDCACRFVGHITQSYPEKLRKQALQLYLEGLGFRAIGRLLKISNVTVLNWVRDAGKSLPERKTPASLEIIELDELCTHIQKNRKNAGYGWLLTVQAVEFLPPNTAAVVFSTPKN